MTAKELLVRNGMDDYTEVCDFMVDFAKYHVALALQEAANRVETYDIKVKEEVICTNGVVVKSSILNAYPLENIK